jgi:hypothetical protein
MTLLIPANISLLRKIDTIPVIDSIVVTRKQTVVAKGANKNIMLPSQFFGAI